MLKLLKAAMLVCLVSSITATMAAAAPVFFQGTVTNPANPLFANGTLVGLALDYTPGIGLSAVVNSASLSIGGEIWSTLVGGGNQLTIVTNGAANDDLNIQLAFAGSSPTGIGSIVSAFNLTINGTNDLGPAPDATAANVGLLAKNGNLASGNLFVFGGPGVPGGGTFINFSGTAVPEPGSIALLSGLGLVFGRGAWRRRRNEKSVDAV